MTWFLASRDVCFLCFFEDSIIKYYSISFSYQTLHRFLSSLHLDPFLSRFNSSGKLNEKTFRLSSLTADGGASKSLPLAWHAKLHFLIMYLVNIHRVKDRSVAPYLHLLMTYIMIATICFVFSVAEPARLSAKTGWVPVDFRNRTAHQEAEQLG